MLVSRLFEPAVGQLVYHYCSAETFRAIMESGRLRFTDINMLNDAEESRCGYSAFEEAATRLIKRKGVPATVPHMDIGFFNSVDEIISRIQFIAHPFVSCFSQERDSLGQWRAYADDGRGFAIGFNASLLAKLPVSFLSIEYDRERQIEEMMVALAATFIRQTDESTADPKLFFEDCVLLAIYMTAFKNSGFSYEREIRCVHAVNIKNDEYGLRFIDPGGQGPDGQAVASSPIAFQVRGNHLCAYLDISFGSNPTAHAVAEVILGPKNHSPFGNILLYLGGLSYSSVTLRKSTVPYR